MSLYVFNNQQKVIKVIQYKRIVEAVQEIELNGTDELTVEIPNIDWDALEEEPLYLAVRDTVERFSFHMYKILREDVSDDTVTVKGVQIGYDEMKAYGYFKDRRFTQASMQSVANAIVGGTDWQVGFVDSNLPAISTNFYYISRLEAIRKVIEANGCEIRFRVEITGNRIVAKRIDFLKRMSSDKGKRFSYGSKLLSVVKEKDSAELYTALVGRGKGEEVGDGYGRRIGFEDIEWSISNGDPVDKPIGQEFVELPDMTALYGYPDGEPRTGIVIFEDTEDETLLLQQTYEKLIEVSRPQVQFKAIVQLIGDAELGETVSIIRHDLNFKYKTRVFKIRRNLLDNSRTEVELGDRITESLGRIIKRIDTTGQRREDRIVEFVQNTANGKNKIFRQEATPTTGMTVNDLWYKPVGEGEIEMYQWNGTIWELVVSTGINSGTNQAIDEAKGIAERARDHSNLLQLDADSILAGLGVEGIVEVNQAIVNQIQLNVGDKIDNLIATKVDENSIQYQSLIERYDLYERVIGSSEEGIKDNVARIVMSDSLFRTEVVDVLSDTSTAVTQLSNSWALQITSNDDLVTAINASSNGVHIQGKNIILDGDTVVDGTFTVTDTIFADNMDISKFTVGTLNGANVNLINVNAQNIVGNVTEFVRSAWNNNNSSVSIDGSGIHSIDGSDRALLANGSLDMNSTSSGYPTEVKLDGVGLEFKARNNTARMRFNGTNIVMDEANLGMNRNHINSVDWIRIIGKPGETIDTTIFNSPNHPGALIADTHQIAIGVGSRESVSRIAEFSGTINFRRNLHMNGNNIQSVSRVALDGSNTHFLSHHAQAGGVIVDSTRFTIGIGSINTGFNDRVTVTNSQIDLRAHTNLRGFRLNEVARMELSGTNGHYMHLSSGSAIVDTRMVTIAIGTPTSVDRVADFYGRVDLYKNLNMNGNVINNQSDRRFKTIIDHVTDDVLGMYRSLDFIRFEYTESDMAKGIHFGLIAQDAGQLGYYDADSDRWMINSSDQIMYNSLAIKQLAEQHEDELECLRKEVKKLKEEIVELRGMCA